jgi:sugar transferase (PEP-CTERM/EpsH1 system associated)
MTAATVAQNGNSPTARLLFVNHSLHMGGIETMIDDFARSLRPAGFDVGVAVFRGGGQLAAGLAGSGIPVSDLHKREGLDFGLVMRLRRLLRASKTSVIHSHNYSAWLYSVLASLGLGGIKRIHTEHSRVQPLPRRRAMERWLARYTHAVVGVSDDVAQSLVTEVGIEPTRVCFIANGINLSRYRPDPALRASLREELGIAPTTLVYGIVARLVPVKAHVDLIDAFHIVQQRQPATRLVIAGDGPCGADLKAQVTRLGLTPCVHFLGEVRDTERVLNALDVYMLSSTDEGMNLTLLEAMATGLPVIATSVGGNPEVVAEANTGLLVPARNPQRMAQAMRELLLKHELRQGFGLAARQRVERQFSQANTLRKYQALYAGLSAAQAAGS